MEQLSEALNRAAADPPPTGIDLDHLIAREHRARGRRRWLAGSAAALAVLVATGTAVLVGPGGWSGAVPGTEPTTKTDPGVRPQELGRCSQNRPVATTPGGGPGGEKPAETSPPSLRPAPTEPTDAAVLRLSLALNATLGDVLPGFSVADHIHPNCEAIQFAPTTSPFLYEAVVVAKDATGYGRIAIGLMPATAEPPIGGCGDEETCVRETLPDGTLIQKIGGVVLGAGLHNQVAIVRPDGTALVLFSQNVQNPDETVTTRPTPPATVDQLIAIGTDPGLTLYP
jgi:hypothetical protein